MLPVEDSDHSEQRDAHRAVGVYGLCNFTQTPPCQAESHTTSRGGRGSYSGEVALRMRSGKSNVTEAAIFLTLRFCKNPSSAFSALVLAVFSIVAIDAGSVQHLSALGLTELSICQHWCAQRSALSPLVLTAFSIGALSFRNLVTGAVLV